MMHARSSLIRENWHCSQLVGANVRKDLGNRSPYRIQLLERAAALEIHCWKLVVQVRILDRAETGTGVSLLI